MLLLTGCSWGDRWLISLLIIILSMRAISPFRWVYNGRLCGIYSYIDLSSINSSIYHLAFSHQFIHTFICPFCYRCQGAEQNNADKENVCVSVSLQRKTVWDLFIYRYIFHQFVHPSFPSSIISSKCYLQYPFCLRRQRDPLASSLVLITHSLTQSLFHQPIPSWFTRTLPLSIARSFTNPLPPSLVHSFIHPSIHPSIHPFIHPSIHYFIHLPGQAPRALTISLTHIGSQLTDGSPPEEDEKPRDTEKISETKVPTSSVSCR